MSSRLWYAKRRVGLLDSGYGQGRLPTGLSITPCVDRDGYPNGKVDVWAHANPIARNIEPNDIHDLVSAAKEMSILPGGRTAEQHARVKSGLPADPPPAEHDGDPDELFGTKEA